MSALRSVDEARALALAAARAVDTETIDIVDADGRVLAHDEHARFDLPNADVSIMDGWAVGAEDVARARACGSDVVLRIEGESAAGHPSAGELARGTAVRISTGAVLPAGADAVIAQEDTRRDGERLIVDPDEAVAVVPGRFVRARAREVRAGQRLLCAGHRLEPGDVALLAATGAARIGVHRRPRVAILGTGDELVAVGEVPGPGQVVNVNSMLLAHAVRRAGGEPRVLPDVRDEPQAVVRALAEAKRADLVVTSGGISVGDHDHVADALVALGVEIRVRGVALRPGKPTTFGVHGDVLFFALPGNPASGLVAFELFVRPALLRRAGIAGPVGRPWRRVRLRDAIPGAGRREHFVRAQLFAGDEVAALHAQLSSDLRSIADFDALVRVPAGVGDLPAGAMADALVLRELAPREDPTA